MTSVAVAVALLVSSAQGCGVPAPSAVPWGGAETLEYELSAPRTPGTARATLRLTGGAGQLQLSGEASLAAPFGIYRARGKARASVDEATLRPQRYSDEIVDGSGRETTEVRFRPGPAIRIEWTRRGRKGVNAFVRQEHVLDALTAIYRLRAAALAPGADLCFDLVGARKAWRVSGSVGAAERIETRAGTFSALRIEARAVRTDRPKETARLRLWVSDDARRLPVRATIETDLGSLTARLSGVGASR